MSSKRMLLEIGSFLELFLIFNVLAQPALRDAPCLYKDTMDFTNETNKTDETYDYYGIKVPADRTGIYNYTMLVGHNKIPSNIHLRGCVCPNEILPCLSLCCPPGEEFNNVICIKLVPGIEPPTELKITLKNKTVILKDAYDFTLQSYRTCESIDEFNIEDGKYSLFEDGTLVTYPDEKNEKIYNKDQYCLSPIRYNQEFLFQPYLCSMPIEDNDTKIVNINSYIMLSSVPFMFITILVFIIQPEVKLHNLSMCCYLFALSITFVTLPIINLIKNLNPIPCWILGHLSYFAFTSSYTWLSVVSFDLLVSLEEVVEHTEWDVFSKYLKFGWGLPSLFLVIVCIFDTNFFPIPEHLKPKIGTEAFCFFDDNFWNKFIYFHIPCMVFISFNILVLVLTVRKMNRSLLNDDVEKTKRTGIKNLIRRYMKQYGMVARLVLLTGCCWVFEFSVNFFPEVKIFQYTMYLILFQGHLIFLLFILRKKSLKLIITKYRKIFPKDELGIGMKTQRSNGSQRDTSL